jgi:hypothetical protein
VNRLYIKKLYIELFWQHDFCLKKLMMINERNYTETAFRSNATTLAIQRSLIEVSFFQLEEQNATTSDEIACQKQRY